MRFGASCCPTWDPSNWFSRKLPSLMSFWMLNKSRQTENQKLLRTASEEEIFKKRPKRKVKKRRKSADDQPSSICTNTTETTSRKDQDSNTESSVSENCHSNSVKPRKRRSRREQQALAAKSSRGGKSGYTAANLRRYAAERKPTSKQALELGNRSQSTSALGIKRMTTASANQNEKGTNE